jgi:hypothetical protein
MSRPGGRSGVRSVQHLIVPDPAAALAAQENRAFLGRAVRFLVHETGIRQFLVIGAPPPTGGNVHQVAQEVDPLARVVYCDDDPAIVVQANALLAREPTVSAVYGDLRLPRYLLIMLAVRSLVDLSKPLAVLLAEVLSSIEDSDDPWRILDQVKSAMAPGSYLVLSHVTDDGHPEESDRPEFGGSERGFMPSVARSRAEIAQFFDGLDLLAPGLVGVSDWRPAHGHDRPQTVLTYAGVARKPGHIPGVSA